MITHRAKSIETNEWEFGQYLVLNGRHMIIKTESSSTIIPYVEVIGETVSRAVGIPDVKGVPMFEGDFDKYGYIVTFINPQDGASSGLTIGWHAQKDDFDKSHDIDATQSEEFEICGNIYDQPEHKEGLDKAHTVLWQWENYVNTLSKPSFNKQEG
jgi:hypothetical protein